MNSVNINYVNRKLVIPNTVNTNLVNTSSVNTNPLNRNPVSANSVNRNSINTNFVNTNLVNNNPVNTNSVNRNIINTNTVNTNPVNMPSVNTNPVNTPSVNTNPVNTTYVNTSTVNTNPVNTNTVNTNPVNTPSANTNSVNTNSNEVITSEQTSRKEVLPRASSQTKTTDYSNEILEDYENFHDKIIHVTDIIDPHFSGLKKMKAIIPTGIIISTICDIVAQIKNTQSFPPKEWIHSYISLHTQHLDPKDKTPLHLFLESFGKCYYAEHINKRAQPFTRCFRDREELSLEPVEQDVLLKKTKNKKQNNTRQTHINRTKTSKQIWLMEKVKSVSLEIEK